MIANYYSFICSKFVDLLICMYVKIDKILMSLHEMILYAWILIWTNDDELILPINYDDALLLAILMACNEVLDIRSCHAFVYDIINNT